MTPPGLLAWMDGQYLVDISPPMMREIMQIFLVSYQLTRCLSEKLLCTGPHLQSFPHLFESKVAILLVHVGGLHKRQEGEIKVMDFSPRPNSLESRLSAPPACYGVWEMSDDHKAIPLLQRSKHRLHRTLPSIPRIRVRSPLPSTSAQL